MSLPTEPFSNYVISSSPAQPHQCPDCGIWHANHGCVGGSQHGAVLTRSDDDDAYDERVLGPIPNGYQYGYCGRCHQPFRWDVSNQRWMPWTDEERHLARIEMAKEATLRQQKLEAELA